MMDEKIEAIEVNLLSDNDVRKEKLTQTTNGIDHALNGTRLGSITDDCPTNNGQPLEKDQSIGTVNEHKNWAWGFYEQVKSLCFPVSKKAERQQRLKMIIFGLAIFTVIAVFMVPVILYYTAPPIPTTDDSAVNFFKTCIPDCSNYVQTSQVCGANAMDNPYSIIPGHFAGNQEEAEKKLLEISNIASQCSNNDTAMSFFCKAVYFTCSNNSDLFPTYHECIQLQNDTCREQWRDLQSVSTTVTCCNGYNPESPCPDQFARFCGVCTPVCHEFSQYGKAATVALDVIAAISMIMNILFGLLVFVAAFFKRKAMFHFPNVLILYFTAVFTIYAFFILITIFGSKDLLCSHDNLFIAVTESTTFCQIQGFCLDAGLLMYTEFWLLYVFHLFMKIVDPLKTWVINKQKYARRVHIIEVVAVCFFGLLTPITISATDGYHIATLPPRACLSAPEVVFHGTLLPIIMMCIVGISLILVTFFHIHRTKGIFKRTKKGVFTLSVPEVKLLVISFYLTIVMGVSIIHFTLTVRDLNDIYGSIMNYSHCVASGNCDCGDAREILENTSLISEMNFVVYICVMFLNASNLLFIIQAEDVKQMVKRATKSFISTDTTL